VKKEESQKYLLNAYRVFAYACTAGDGNFLFRRAMRPIPLEIQNFMIRLSTISPVSGFQFYLDDVCS